jgi:hypothetical protein
MTYVDHLRKLNLLEHPDLTLESGICDLIFYDRHGSESDCVGCTIVCE